MKVNIRCRCGRCTPIESVSTAAMPTCPACGRVLVAPSARAAGATSTSTSMSGKMSPPTPPPLPAAAGRVASPWRAPTPGRYALPAALGAGGGLAVLLLIALFWRAGAGRPDPRPAGPIDAAGEPRLVAAPIPGAAPAPAPLAAPAEALAHEPGPARPAPAPAVAAPAPDPAPTRPLTTREIVERTEASVALIKGKQGSGSGFLIGPGTVATNCHVVRHELVRNIEVYFPSAPEAEKGPHRATLRYEDPKRDLAIIAVETPLPAIPVAKGHRFIRGEDVTIVGSPGALRGQLILQNAVCKGVLSSEADIDGMHYYQLSAAVNHGNSGGPAMNSSGEVVGIVTLKSAAEEAIGFCIPIDEVAAALKDLEGRPAADGAAVRKHDAAALYYGLHLLCETYAKVLNVYLTKMMDAIQQGDQANDGFRSTREAIGDKLNDLDKVADDIKDELSRVDGGGGVRLSPEASGAMRSLWTCYTEMKRLIDRPQGTFDSFRARTFELKDRFARASRILERELGVEPDD